MSPGTNGSSLQATNGNIEWLQPAFLYWWPKKEQLREHFKFSSFPTPKKGTTKKIPAMVMLSVQSFMQNSTYCLADIHALLKMSAQVLTSPLPVNHSSLAQGLQKLLAAGRSRLLKGVPLGFPSNSYLAHRFGFRLELPGSPTSHITCLAGSTHQLGCTPEAQIWLDRKGE